MTVPRPDVEKPTLNTPSDLAGKQGEISNANGITPDTSQSSCSLDIDQLVTEFNTSSI